MPAQSNAPTTVFYVEGDTAPSLRAQLIDDEGNGVSLVSANGVAITIAPTRWSYYYSPVAPIVENAACVIDPDQSTYPGFVDWYPDIDDLSPSGDYEYRFAVTWSDNTVQTFPSNETLRLTIRARIGGNL